MVFESKKTQIRIEFLDWTQKSQTSSQKKFGLGLEDFTSIFCEVDHPLCGVWKKKTQISIEFLDWTQKSPASSQKSLARV